MGGEPHQDYLLGFAVPTPGGTRGKKRALIAVGHSMLVVFYHMLKEGTTYAELGGDFFESSRV